MDENLLNRISSQEAISLEKTASIPDREGNIRFEKHSPFVTLMMMTFGPFITTLTTTLMDFLELYFLTKRFSQNSLIKPVQLQGFGGFCIAFVVLISTYFGTAISTRLSRVLGENREKDAVQLFTDVLKLSILFVFISVPFLQFIIYPLLSFTGCPEFMLDASYRYVLVFYAGTPFIVLFNICCSFLQSNGRSILNGFLHIGQSVMQVLILCPLFLFAFQIDITLIGLQSVVSYAFIGVVLIIMIYTNKFGFTMTLSSYAQPIITDTVKALKNSLPCVVGFVCAVVPPIFSMKFLLSTAKSPAEVESLAGVQTILSKLQLLSSSVMIAVSNGLMTVATFAFGAHDFKRLMKYFVISILVSVAFNVVFSIFMIAKPELIASIYLESNSDLQLCRKILKIPYYTSWIAPINSMCQILLVSTGKPLRSSIPSFVQTFIVIILVFAFSKIYKDRPERIFHAYNINDVVMLILSLALTFPTILKIRKEISKNAEDTTTLIEQPDIYEN